MEKWKIEQTRGNNVFEYTLFRMVGAFPGKMASIEFVSEEKAKTCSELIGSAPQTKQQRDDLLKACEIGLTYVEGSNACAMPDCSVCKQKRENVKRIKQAIANATEE